MRFLRLTGSAAKGMAVLLWLGGGQPAMALAAVAELGGGSLRQWVLLTSGWTFLFVSLFLVLVTLGKTARWVQRLKAAREAPPRQAFRLQFKVRTTAGTVRHYAFESFPVTVSSAGSADLLLPDPRGIRRRFRIDYREGRAWLQAEAPVVVNGVPKTEKPLRPDDRILFGSYRLDFQDAAFTVFPPRLPPRPGYAWRVPTVAALLALSVLFRQASGLPEELAAARRARMVEQRRARAVTAALQEEAQARMSRIGSSPAQAAQPVAGPTPEAPAGRPPRPAPEVAEPTKPGERRSSLPAHAVAAAPRSPSAPASKARPTAVKPPGAPAAGGVPRSGGSFAAPAPAAAPPAPASKPAAATKQPAAAAAPVEAAAQGRAALVAAVAATPAPPGRPERAQPQRAGKEASSTSRPAPVPLADSVPVPAARVVAAAPPVRPAPPPDHSPPAPVAAAPVAPARPAPPPPTPVAPTPVAASVAAAPVAAAPPAEYETAEQRLQRARVQTFAPGLAVAFFKVDVLFIHAHPDDESLDFGVLMSRLFRAGGRIGTVLFTDGEAGLDRYPKRVIGGLYPNHPLRGAELARVRVREAQEALSLLGSQAYVRLGLGNRPYNTLRDEVPLPKVIEGWGGEGFLVDELVQLLRGFRPEVVVSPDGPSAAHEHFEHEAVGFLVQRALERLKRNGESFVKGHLVCVDPFQRQAYGELVGIDAAVRDPRSGISQRDIQALALEKHVSQRDASVIGLQRLPPLPEEYYRVVRWNLERPLEEWLLVPRPEAP